MINKLIEKWKNRQPCINAWLSVPNSFTAEAFGKMGWDSITIDMQHGLNDYHTSIAMVQALVNSQSVPFVRVPWNEPSIIMKTLDLGVMGIIAPMINTKKDCEDFVSYCKYPPMGKRSFGPIRAQLVHGADYYENANSNIFCFAMIETEEAVNNLDESLEVEDIDVFFVAPNDLAATMGYIGRSDDKKVLDTIEDTLKRIVASGKNAGTLTTASMLDHYLNIGVNCICVNIGPFLNEGITSVSNIINSK